MVFVNEKAAGRLLKTIDFIEKAVPYIVGGAVVFLLVWMVGKV